MFITTLRQLEELPFWAYVVDFAESHNGPNVKWIFNSLHQDLADENLYHVHFDVPSSREKSLTFDLKMEKGTPKFFNTVVK